MVNGYRIVEPNTIEARLTESSRNWCNALAEALERIYFKKVSDIETLTEVVHEIKEGDPNYLGVTYMRPARLHALSGTRKHIGGENREPGYSRVLVPTAHAGSPFVTPQAVRVSDDNLLGRVYREGITLANSQLMALPVFGAPINGKHVKYGALYVKARTPLFNQEGEPGKLMFLANKLASWNDYLHEHDTLTGALSHLQLQRDLPLLIEDALKSGRELGILYVDGNGLKFFNDTFSHIIGDEWIRGLGHGFTQSCRREEDDVYRQGMTSDEFIFTLPETSQEGVEVFDKQIARPTVKKHLLSLIGTTLPTDVPEELVERPYSSGYLEVQQFIREWEAKGENPLFQSIGGFMKALLQEVEERMKKDKRTSGVSR